MAVSKGRRCNFFGAVSQGRKSSATTADNASSCAGPPRAAFITPSLTKFFPFCLQQAVSVSSTLARTIPVTCFLSSTSSMLTMLGISPCVFCIGSSVVWWSCQFNPYQIPGLRLFSNVRENFHTLSRRRSFGALAGAGGLPPAGEPEGQRPSGFF